MTNVSRALTLVLVVIFVGSLTMLYGKVTEMYAPEKFEEPLAREARNLLTRLQPQMRLLWEETAPVYSELATKKMNETFPMLQEASERELETLMTEIRLGADREIGAALNRVGGKYEEQLREQFPTIASEATAEARILEWAETFEGDFEQVLVHFQKRYLEDLGHLEATLEQFRNTEDDLSSEEELSRQFVHLWLMKLDRWVISADDGERLETMEVSHVR